MINVVIKGAVSSTSRATAPNAQRTPHVINVINVINVFI